MKEEKKDLTEEERQMIREEAEVIYTCKGWSYKSALIEAEKRIREALGK